MAIKLILLKSGEDMIADVNEMTFGEDDNRRVIGYSLNRPCVIKMRDPNVIPELQEGNTKKCSLSYFAISAIFYHFIISYITFL